MQQTSGIQKEKIVIVNNFQEVYYPIPKTEAVRKDLEIISDETFKYILANEITYVCSPFKTELERVACRDEFLDLQ